MKQYQAEFSLNRKQRGLLNACSTRILLFYINYSLHINWSFLRKLASTRLVATPG